MKYEIYTQNTCTYQYIRNKNIVTESSNKDFKVLFTQFILAMVDVAHKQMIV